MTLHHFFCPLCKHNWSSTQPDPGPCMHCGCETVRRIMIHFAVLPTEGDYVAYFDGDPESMEYGYGVDERAAVGDLIENYGGE